LITKQDNLDWVKANEETLIGQLVLYHSPVDLAHIVLHPEKWTDAVVEKTRRTLEKSEGLLDEEKQKRKEVAAKKPKPKVVETDEDAEKRIQREKAAKTEEAVEQKRRDSVEEAELPD
jgi:hypothetical protein